MRCLSKAFKLYLTANGKETVFVIEENKGAGGSCVAYRVTYKENDDIIHHGILKEYCPAFLENTGAPLRNADGSLIIPDEYSSAFNSGLEYFRNTYQNINDYLYNNLSASNFHTVQLGLYEGNNTLYTLVSCDCGKTYDKVTDKSFYELLKIMLSVTKAVELYHKAGFLHLDIKPKNILILDGVTDLVKLFDFDSLTSIDGLRNGSVMQIPNPEDYYVPELFNRNIHNISIKTDIFEIGAMLYKRIFGEAPQEENIGYDAVYNFDTAPLLNGISPKAKYELEEIFRHTLQISPRQRYSNTEKLCDALENLIEIVRSKDAYLINLPKWQPSKYCVGRQDELKELKTRLDRDGFAFVKAMGGTGKSELAKLYAEKYAVEYHTVQFCKYNGSLKSVVGSLEINGINDSDYEKYSKLIKEKNKVLHSSDNHTLLIVDNFNVTYDEFLREFLPAQADGFKVIFTTRCMPAAEYYEKNVMELENLPQETAKILFYSRSFLESNHANDLIIENILSTIQYNTLVLVLVAQAIKNRSCSLAEINEKLINSQLDNINGNVFHEYDFSSIDGENYAKVFAHLNTIFNISHLTALQKEILKDMTLVANIGIIPDELRTLSKNDSFTDGEIVNLINLGWLNTENEYLSLHPIVSDLIFANNSVPKQESFNNFAKELTEACGIMDNTHINDLNTQFAYLFHLDKRSGGIEQFTSLDIKLMLAKCYFDLYDFKNSNNKLSEAEIIIENNSKVKYKIRKSFAYNLKAEIEKKSGSLDNAIELYKNAVHILKKHPVSAVFFYDLYFESIRAIGECYQDKHDYKKAYEWYLKAYNYAVNDSAMDKFQKALLPDHPKELSIKVPELCDRIIEVCKELKNPNEAEKFKKTKVDIISSNKLLMNEDEVVYYDKVNEFSDEITRGLDYIFKNGDIKGAACQWAGAIEKAEDLYGKDSPLVIDIKSEIEPFVVFANEGTLTFHVLEQSFEFIKTTYGENSRRFADYVINISQFIGETEDYPQAEKYIAKAIEIYKNLGLINSYNYQLALLVLTGIYLMDGKISALKETINQIDYGFFTSKNDYERLVKHLCYALLEIKEYDKAIEICNTLVKEENVMPTIYVQACECAAEAYIENHDYDNALIYLDLCKPVLDKFCDGHIKNELLPTYYAEYAPCIANKQSNEEAIKILDDFLNEYNADDSFISDMNLFRIYIIRTYFYFNIQDYQGGLESIKPTEPYLDSEIPLKMKIWALNLLSVFYSGTGDVDKGIKYFTKFVRCINVFYTKKMFMN